MNILFINPPNDPYSSQGILIEPIDLLSVATYAKSKGHFVEVLDMDVNKLRPSQIFENIFFTHIDLAVIVFDYHIPLHDSGTNAVVRSISRALKEKNIVVALAGKFATFGLESEAIALDAHVYLKKDIEPFLDWLPTTKNFCILDNICSAPNCRYLKNGRLVDSAVTSPKPSISQYPIADRNLLDLTKYIDVRTILSSRGCNLKCSFCHVPGFWGSWQGRDVKSVVDEIHYLEKKFNAKKILFLDDNAAANKKQLYALCSELEHRPTSAKLGLLATILSFEEELFHKMFLNGFRWVHFGAESADDALLDQMNKKIKFDQTKIAVKKCQNMGYRVRTSWILDMPNTSVAAFDKTIEAILELQTPEIRLHYLTIRLGSFLHKEFGLNIRQFIHSNKQNLNLSGLSSEYIQNKVQWLIQELLKKGYNLVVNPDDFKNINDMKKQNPELKIVSLCPLRYGLNWECIE